MLAQRRKRDIDLTDADHANLLTAANAGKFDHLFKAPEEPEPEQPNQVDAALAADAPDLSGAPVDLQVGAFVENMTEEESFIIQIQEACAAVGMTDGQRVMASVQKWAKNVNVKCVGNVGTMHTATDEQKKALFDCIRDKRGYFIWGDEKK
jgi:hypothetical protein